MKDFTGKFLYIFFISQKPFLIAKEIDLQHLDSFMKWKTWSATVHRRN